MMRIILLFLVLSCASCALFDGYKKRQFNYRDGSESFSLLVPKGWRKGEIRTASTGNKEQLYYYKNGSQIYFVQVGDTTKSYRFIDTSLHIPLVHPLGGVIYKGIDSSGLYWREIQRAHFRFGYKRVPTEKEAKFDSALNYAALMKGIK